MSLTKKQVKGNQGKIISLLEQTKRPGIDELVKWLSASDFFTAPASTRENYHGAYSGGLAFHSLNAYDAFQKKVRQYELDLGEDEKIIASLGHDLCKVNTYKPNMLKSGKLSASKPYNVEDKLPLGHGEKSLYIVRQHVELTGNEALLIRWHMGPFDANWEIYEPKVAAACPSIYAFHAADQEASKYLD